MTTHPRVTDERATTRRERRPDRGFSIIEVIVTITLVGIVMAAVMDSVITLQRASATSRSAAQIETAIVNAADRVNRAKKDCDYSKYAQAAVQMQGWNPNLVSLSQEYYVPGATAASPGTWQAGTAKPACPGLQPTDLLVQRVTITITTPDGHARRSVQVVKSDV